MYLNSYSSNSQYNASLLNGTNSGYDASVGGTPSGNFVTIWHIDEASAKNILSIGFVGTEAYGPYLGPTGKKLASFNSDTTVAQDRGNYAIYTYAYNSSLMPEDSSDAYITKNSAAGSWGIIKNTDGTLTIYYNQGNLQDKHPETAAQVANGTVFNNDADGIEAAAPVLTNPDYSATTSYTFSAVTLDFIDPTQSYKVNYKVNHYSTEGYSVSLPGSAVSAPAKGASDGQSTIKIHYMDEDGKELKTVSTNPGWPVGNTSGQTPTPDLAVTAPDIPGYTYKSVSSTDSTSFNNDGTGSVAYPAAGTTTTVTYVYTANNQKVVYNVIDDTDKKNLATSQDFASGKSDANLPDTAQTDYDAIIKSYTDQGYELVPETTDPVPGVFDHDDADQVINIHLKHGTTTQEVTENVTRTVHYIVEGDLCEAPEDVKDTVYFTRTETRDSVSNAVIDAGQWTSDDACCDAVVSPKLENFTADTLVVPTIETVKPEDDDTTVNVLYTASLETTTETKNITETIHYVYEDGSEAAPDKTDKVSFTREVTTNLATGEVTYGAWTAENGDTRFDAVTSPLIDGYTVDKLSVDAVTGLTADSEDAVTTVTYKKDAADPAPTPDPTDTPTTPSSTPKTTITVQPTSQTTKKSVLPSTGDEQRSMITVAGGLTVLGAGLLGVARFLRRKKQ
ncbi:hypothetical protein OfM2_04080 [Lactovum odontotermitis]